MRTIIAGSRNIGSVALVDWAVQQSGFQITQVVGGMAGGIDTYGMHWANEKGIPFHPYPANWESEGRSAGYKRNVRMAEYSQALVAIWDGVSKGTKHMIKIATDHGLLVFVYRHTPEMDPVYHAITEQFQVG